MRVSLAQLLIATSQRKSQLVFQFVKVSQLSLYVSELVLQAALYRCARLHPIPAQAQKPANLAELESEALHAAHEGQRFYVLLVKSSEATFCSRRSG